MNDEAVEAAVPNKKVAAPAQDKEGQAAVASEDYGLKEFGF